VGPHCRRSSRIIACAGASDSPAGRRSRNATSAVIWAPRVREVLEAVIGNRRRSRLGRLGGRACGAAVAVHVGLAVLPSWLKVPLYRLFFRYQSAAACGSGFRHSSASSVSDRRPRPHGSRQLVRRSRSCHRGRNAHIGFGNVFRGGRRIASAITRRFCG